MKLFHSDENRHYVPDPGIVYGGQYMEFWLPTYMAKHLPYDPRKLPVSITTCTIEAHRVTYWSWDGVVWTAFKTIFRRET